MALFAASDLSASTRSEISSTRIYSGLRAKAWHSMLYMIQQYIHLIEFKHAYSGVISWITTASSRQLNLMFN